MQSLGQQVIDVISDVVFEVLLKLSCVMLYYCMLLYVGINMMLV